MPGVRPTCAERCPARRLQAAYDGWHVVEIEDVIATTDVVATATDAKKVLNAALLDQVKNGVFILNVGHVAEEINCEYLKQYPNQEVMPFINTYSVG